MIIDLRIENGHLLDPAIGLDGDGSIAIAEGRIYDSAEGSAQKLVIDASGCYVTAGWIDFHTHVFNQGSELGLPADAFLATGVTSTVDAGSAGWANFPAFHATSISNSKCRIKAQLNISASGMFQIGYPEDYDPNYLRPDRIREIVERYSDTIIGLKLRFSEETISEWGIDCLYKALEIAEHVGLPLAVHTTEPPTETYEIARILRPLDVYCHVYQNTGRTILDKFGRVHDEIFLAQKRGVVMDSSNGVMNFGFDVALKAISQGMKPDVVSTDLTRRSFAQPYFVKSLPFVMAKHLTMGLTLSEVISAVTTRPAALMGETGRIGTLAPGADADVTIFRLEKGEVVFRDRMGASLTGLDRIVPRLVIRGGTIMYCAEDFWSG